MSLQFLPWMDSRGSFQSFAGAFPRIFRPEADIDAQPAEDAWVPIAKQNALAKEKAVPAAAPAAATGGTLRLLSLPCSPCDVWNSCIPPIGNLKRHLNMRCSASKRHLQSCHAEVCKDQRSYAFSIGTNRVLITLWSSTEPLSTYVRILW